MTIELVLPKRGHCARCMRKWATTDIFSRFDTPIPATDKFPEHTGVWVEVCDGCLKPDDEVTND